MGHLYFDHMCSFRKCDPRDAASFLLRHQLPLIDWDEVSDHFGFTILHKIVCGLECHDLASAIQSHPPNVNKTDHFGYQPLDLAVVHQKPEQVETLVDSGATSRQALSSALQLGNLEIIEILYRSVLPGSHIDHGVSQHWSFNCERDCEDSILEIDKLLLQYSDVDTRDDLGRTLLMNCIRNLQSCTLARMELLIDHGADVNAIDNFGRPVLYFGIEAEVVEFLVRHGARLDLVDAWGNNIFHHAIHCVSYPETAEALSNSDMTEVDLEARNRDGHTAFDLLQKRNSLTWDSYLESRNISDSIYLASSRAYTIGTEIAVIYSLEALLHKVQDSQGIPKEHQYPSLGEYLNSRVDDELVPGAWPV